MAKTPPHAPDTEGSSESPDGRFHIIGDQVSPLPGWKEGAMVSAQYVAGQVMGLESTDVPEVRQAPDSRALTTGRI
ncbi:hypothetical protein AB0I28_13970 [Phytomonospora sp. NPDC050363]|uniref:hypothetical protein n=1 Tax=Phytomonospora sp. NPDC050363 TaxID=3155642 RepID=UPI0033D0FF06